MDVPGKGIETRDATPRIKIDRFIYEILRQIPFRIPGIEVSGMAKFSGNLLTGCIDDIYFPKNLTARASSGVTVIDGIDWALILDKLEMQGIDSVEAGRVWWHSHHHLGYHPSGQDIATMKKAGAGGSEWTLNIITSTKGIACYLCIYHPIFRIMACELVPIQRELEDCQIEKRTQAVKAEIMRQMQDLPITDKAQLIEKLASNLEWERSEIIDEIMKTLLPEKKIGEYLDATASLFEYNESDLFIEDEYTCLNCGEKVNGDKCPNGCWPYEE